MTVEERALALVNEVQAEKECLPVTAASRATNPSFEALCRALERHEAYRQEVSEAVSYCIGQGMAGHHRATLDRFIIAPPVDPITDAVAEALDFDTEAARQHIAALAKHGLKIAPITEGE